MRDFRDFEPEEPDDRFDALDLLPDDDDRLVAFDRDEPERLEELLRTLERFFVVERLRSILRVLERVRVPFLTSCVVRLVPLPRSMRGRTYLLPGVTLCPLRGVMTSRLRY